MLLLVIPHYPSQTHVFFRREIEALRRLGVPASVLSTRRPPAEETCHAWTRQAMAETRYLLPVGLRGALDALLTVLLRLPGSGGAVWRRYRDCRSSGSGGRLRTAALVAMGAVAARHARRLGVRHIHAHSAADAAYVALFAAAWEQLPYSVTLHGRLEDYGGGQRAKWGHAAFGIAVNSRLRAEILAAVPGLAPDRIHVAPMGVDVERFGRSAPWRAPAPGEPLRVVTCGRLHRTKGHQDLIESVALLAAGGTQVRLDVIGEGPDRPMLEAAIAKLGAASFVKLAGALDGDAVRERLAAAHVFALASHEEAVGVATMEAMAMEMPVVVTDVGGVSELVRHGIDGHLVPARNPAALAAALAQVAADADASRRMGRAGAARVRELFHSGRSAELLSRLAGLDGSVRP